MYNLKEFTTDLDLSDFYRIANDRGFDNNSNQKLLVDCFKNESRSQTWILYYNNNAVGSVGCHTLDFLNNHSYRICARTCVFTDLLPIQHLRSLNYTIKRHQNITAQFYIPTCINWAGKENDLYITSHPSEVGTQRGVHNVYCPALVETGALIKAFETEYRGHVQTFWKLNTNVFLNQLDNNPRWALE